MKKPIKIIKKEIKLTQLVLILLVILILLVWLTLIFIVGWNKLQSNFEDIRLGEGVQKISKNDEKNLILVRLDQTYLTNASNLSLIFSYEGGEFIYGPNFISDSYTVDLSEMGGNFSLIKDISLRVLYRNASSSQSTASSNFPSGGGDSSSSGSPSSDGGSDTGDDEPLGCTPTTCEDFLEDEFYPPRCGTEEDDGCGGTLNCSDNCAEDQTCFGGLDSIGAICINNSQICGDSDGGKDYNLLGDVEMEGINFIDECVGNKNLTEYSCYYNSTLRGMQILNETVECADLCFEGACMGTILCEDSDEGQDYFTQGNVKDGYGNLLEDECVGENSLKEYYCGADFSFEFENNATSEVYDCYNNFQTCSGGSCVDWKYKPEGNLITNGNFKEYNDSAVFDPSISTSFQVTGWKLLGAGGTIGWYFNGDNFPKNVLIQFGNRGGNRLTALKPGPSLEPLEVIPGNLYHLKFTIDYYPGFNLAGTYVTFGGHTFSLDNPISYIYEFFVIASTNESLEFVLPKSASSYNARYTLHNVVLEDASYMNEYGSCEGIPANYCARDSECFEFYDENGIIKCFDLPNCVIYEDYEKDQIFCIDVEDCEEIYEDGNGYCLSLGSEDYLTSGDYGSSGTLESMGFIARFIEFFKKLFGF